MSLYAGVQDVLRPGIAKRRSVLIQKIHQLFGDLSVEMEKISLYVSYVRTRQKTMRRIALFLLGGMKKFFSSVGILRLAMLPAEILGDLFRGELGFANVAKVSGKMNGFS